MKNSSLREVGTNKRPFVDQELIINFSNIKLKEHKEEKKPKLKDNLI